MLSEIPKTVCKIRYSRHNDWVTDFASEMGITFFDCFCVLHATLKVLLLECSEVAGGTVHPLPLHGGHCEEGATTVGQGGRCSVSLCCAVRWRHPDTCLPGVFTTSTPSFQFPGLCSGFCTFGVMMNKAVGGSSTRENDAITRCSRHDVVLFTAPCRHRTAGAHI